ncbi:ABC transporter ATP-binding protein [Ruminiclostridium cellulolyticum]|uniref:ABC transporter related n=1 Tax=Ruminiclostridium cellulolyticum (strain ATCC 35319 / DSM 5812 / JCM 6584 / H10) TaxID=394503 RepID=B8I8J4_RUMCH|nr:ABC transporter ATP-binding protein [Ruminiclostridium cellulolyticum]ACL75227.1 ABC transporter related [Ruminiclostridium cellulolyticum H10]
MAIVNVKQLKKDYDLGRTKVPALRGVDLIIEKGEFVTIAGPSGCGKTTTLNIMGCLDKATSGEVWINDCLINNLEEKKLNSLRLNTIGFIFQAFNLVPVLNVYENVELPLLIIKNVSSNERRERVNYFLKAVGLFEHAKKKPSELSGGQRQRVAVARALVTKPKIVLADEPTANLDSKNGMEIIELMHDISRKESTTFIFSTHDPKVMQKADRIIHMEDGLIKSEVSI